MYNLNSIIILTTPHVGEGESCVPLSASFVFQ